MADEQFKDTDYLNPFTDGFCKLFEIQTE